MASMGPWQNSHGSYYEKLPSNIHSTASMGPWQNSHGSFAGPKTAFSSGGLQWGHDKIVMEVWKCDVNVVVYAVASMGPWQNSHGSEIDRYKNYLHGLASMGPWQNSHGSINLQTSGSGLSTLQWGHDKIVMEVLHHDQIILLWEFASMGPWQNSHGSWSACNC